MRLLSLKSRDNEVGALATGHGVIDLETLNDLFATDWDVNIEALVQSGRVGELNQWYREEFSKINLAHYSSGFRSSKLTYAPIERNPPMILGIGLNYRDHAADLGAVAPQNEPATFMKPRTTIIGPEDAIVIPGKSMRTTAEAELGVVVARRCKDIPKESWLDYIAGFTAILDMTAEDILEQNPRFLTRSKSFDTFLSLGGELLTPDEFTDLSKVKVATLKHGKVYRENVVSNMTFSPGSLVSFLSSELTLEAGDIILTGTPGAVAISGDDFVEAQIDGFAPLRNAVISELPSSR